MRYATPVLAVLLAGCPPSPTEPPPQQAPPAPPPPQTSSQAWLEGKVVKVADGDTITILVDNQQHRIRLHGIDCPEKGQPFGNRAKQFTSDKAFGKVMSVEVKDTDRYGRKVGVAVLPDGLSLNALLVNKGLVWWYRKYAPDDESLATLEKEAREAKVGLWSEADPVPPWEWRKR